MNDNLPTANIPRKSAINSLAVQGLNETANQCHADEIPGGQPDQQRRCGSGTCAGFRDEVEYAEQFTEDKQDEDNARRKEYPEPFGRIARDEMPLFCGAQRISRIADGSRNACAVGCAAPVSMAATPVGIVHANTVNAGIFRRC